MNHHPFLARPSRQSPLFSRPRVSDALEWEELPSLTGALRRSDFLTTRGSVWHSTEPMGLMSVEPAPGPAPFVEAVDGLLVREIVGDEVFKHFFGDPSANH
ncbi:MAG: hypothetical protein U1E89_09385 [Burkholderiaceae bacterium]